jgi:phosphate transport system substrate-binding protein
LSFVEPNQPPASEMEMQIQPKPQRCGLSRFSRAAAILLALLTTSYAAASAADEIKIGGATTALGTIQILAEKFSQIHPEIRIATVPSMGSLGGIKAVASGAIQLSIATRSLDAGESKLGLTQLEFALTPFVFAVSANSTVGAITRTELANIYSGRLVNWPDGSAIRVVLRPADNMNTAIVKRISPGIERGVLAAERRRGMQVAVTDQDSADLIERIPGAIGPTTLAVILSERRALKALKLDGVEPTPANLANRTYPLHKPLYLVTGAKRSPAVERFIAFIQSAAARKILADNGLWVP